MRVIQFEKHKNHKKKGKVRADKNFILQERKKGKSTEGKHMRKPRKKKMQNRKTKKKIDETIKTKPRENGI